jgi:hypothetical protein
VQVERDPQCTSALLVELFHHQLISFGDGRPMDMAGRVALDVFAQAADAGRHMLLKNVGA